MRKNPQNKSIFKQKYNQATALNLNTVLESEL